jgi:hypothetical protein
MIGMGGDARGYPKNVGRRDPLLCHQDGWRHNWLAVAFDGGARERAGSVHDVAFCPGDCLPQCPQSTTYWSVSTSAKAPIGVSFVHFVDDRVSGGIKLDIFPAWCVRGGVNTEQY